jgi:hypothetical protein
LVGVISLAIILAVSLFAAEDLSGKWSGSFKITMDGESNDEFIYMDIKQKGAEITGTAGPSLEQQWPILKGKIEGNKITFEVQSDAPLIKFDLTLADGHLKGNANAEFEGKALKAVVDAQRKVE